MLTNLADSAPTSSNIVLLDDVSFNTSVARKEGVIVRKTGTKNIFGSCIIV
jgi:hypothetical protein